MQLKDNKGQLIRWNENGGYGFILFDGRRVFVHATSYLQGFVPEVGQFVRFDFGLAPDKTKPPMAVKVRVVKSAKAVKAEKQIQAGLEALLKTKIESLSDGTAVVRSKIDGDEPGGAS